jgi:hypothetical protein
MEAAIGRKNVALTIDTTAKQLSNTSRGLQTFEGVENIDNTYVLTTIVHSTATAAAVRQFRRNLHFHIAGHIHGVAADAMPCHCAGR